MKHIWKLAVIGGIALFPQCVALAQEDGCARLDDPSERLACYDRRSGRAAQDSRPIPVPAPPAAASAAAINSYQDRRDALKSRTDFDSRLKAAIPLRHGYHRLELEDGTAYDTTTVAPPPPVGAVIHVRRTPFGTTFFDMEGRKPFTVRLSRRQ
ncbi:MULTISPECIES: hypothetical protein [Sphingobium]|uniref:Type IV pilus biogenesis protein PilP n=2 Tax=Sphingobium fuliginis (strain ATCC 27551) TaxID=336203 RepID=A0A4Q4ITS6_SPHSA|nr:MULTISPECIES: hypothetical protein [Sphingobium]QDC39598.1 hypothetical protein FIL70_20605 [Sphingobium fuliginis ATCC 27551]QOT73903.1 hypothetical protein H5V43_17260 [Sphingobium fuliginis]RYL96792.1 hypothetical protein EWH10_16110 [Sphingobium fuliginis]UXC93360.1 hypothetical protein EGM87_18940 [Sphingobium sp. RSMS]WDA35980.1 hypothetical protein PO876_21405 [Sphingobium sp. YC-XJ3]